MRKYLPEVLPFSQWKMFSNGQIFSNYFPILAVALQGDLLNGLVTVIVLITTRRHGCVTASRVQINRKHAVKFNREHECRKARSYNFDVNAYFEFVSKLS